MSFRYSVLACSRSLGVCRPRQSGRICRGLLHRLQLSETPSCGGLSNRSKLSDAKIHLVYGSFDALDFCRWFCSHCEWYQQDECFELDRRQSQAERTGELQLVLDPEFL